MDKMGLIILSALNVGSGLNVTQIVDAIVEAERVPQENVIQKKLMIKLYLYQHLEQLKGDLSSLDKNLQLLKD